MTQVLPIPGTRKFKEAATERNLREAIRLGILRQEDLAEDLQRACQHGEAMIAELYGNNRLTDQQRLFYTQLIHSLNVYPQQIARVRSVSDLNDWELAAYITNTPGALFRHPVTSTATLLICGSLGLILLILLGWASVSLFSPNTSRPAIQNPIGGLRR